MQLEIFKGQNITMEQYEQWHIRRSKGYLSCCNWL